MGGAGSQPKVRKARTHVDRRLVFLSGARGPLTTGEQEPPHPSIVRRGLEAAVLNVCSGARS